MNLAYISNSCTTSYQEISPPKDQKRKKKMLIGRQKPIPAAAMTPAHFRKASLGVDYYQNAHCFLLNYILFT